MGSLQSSALLSKTQCLLTETTIVFFPIQRQSSPMACGDHHGHSLLLFSRLLQSPCTIQRQLSLMACGDHHGHSFLLFSRLFNLLYHRETIESDSMQRPSWSFVFIVYKTILVSFVIQKHSSSMACRDHHGHSLLLFSRILQSPFTIQRQLSLMACRDHHSHSLLLFSRLLQSPFVIQRQSSPMACGDHHGHFLLLFSRLL